MENCAVKHWGEIESDDSSPHSSVYDNSLGSDIMVDIERSMNTFCLAEFDPDYDDNSNQEEHVTLKSMDHLMLYAISLHKYENDMTDMIKVAEVALESNLITPLNLVPPIPEMAQIQNKHTRNNLNFIPKEFTPFSLGCGPSPPEISSTIVKNVLCKSVATMLAHVGYETTHQSILELLTDILIEFLTKITYRLKLAYDDETKGQHSGFSNIAERVLVEFGMGGIKGLHYYYQTRIIKYIEVLQKRCKELSKHYESLLVKKNPSLVEKDNNLVRVKVEEDDDVIEIDNPQVHLTIDGEVGFSSLDAGYQLLSSLEAGANTQGLGETEEDTSITILPNVISIPETELSSSLSPFTKKRRK